MTSPNWGTASVESWRQYVQQYSGGLPGERAVDRALMWAAIESGGNACSLDTSRGDQLAQGFVPDVGPWQLFFTSPGAAIGGYTSAQLRNTMGCTGISQKQPNISDSARSLATQLSMSWMVDATAQAQSKLDAVGAAWGERDQWRWYKFVTHGLPAYAKCMLWTVNQRQGRPPADWDELRSVGQTITLAEAQVGAADPADNGCSWMTTPNRYGQLPYYATKLQQLAWHNAEEMDLPDEGAIGADINQIIMDVTGDDGRVHSGSDGAGDDGSYGGLTGTEIALIGLAGLAGLFAAFKFSKWLGHTHSV